MRRTAMFYGLFVAILFSPFLLRGEVFVPGDFLPFIFPWRAYIDHFPHNVELFDVPVFFYPQDVFLNTSLKRGEIPLWNPHIFSGHPAVASGQSGFLYPPRLLFHWLLSPAVAKTWIQLLHLLGMGLAMNWFLRIRGFKLYPAALGGLVWMGNTYVTSWLEFEHVAIAGMFLPLLLVCFEKALSGKEAFWWVLPVLGALSLHSGHLQINLYTGAVFLVYAAVRLGEEGKREHLLRFAGVGVLTLGLAAPTVLPFLELLGESQRAPLNLEANAASLWSIILSFLSPDLFGNPTKGFLFNRCPANLIYPEFACFVGMIPLIFALSARGKQARIWQGVALFCVVAASAPFGLSLPLLNRFIPGRILYFVVFCLAYLAALGAEQAQEDAGPARRVSLGLGMVWFLLLGVIGYLLVNPQPLVDWWKANPGGIKLPPLDSNQEQFVSAFRATYAWNLQLLLPLLGCLLVYVRPRAHQVLLIITGFELVWFALGFNTTVKADRMLPTTPEIEAMTTSNRVASIECANYNTLTPYGLSLVNGYESLVYRRYALALSQAEPESNLSMRSLSFRRLDMPILDALSLEYALVRPGKDLATPGWTVVKKGEGGTVYHNEQAQPRAFLVGAVRPLTQLTDLQSFDPSQEAFVTAPPPSDLAPGSGEVRWLHTKANSLELSVTTETTQLLVVTDSFYPGWTCTVDGAPVPLFAANLASRGVYLSPGTHMVRMEFRPESFRNGLVGAMISGLLIGILWLLPLVRKRESSAPEK